MNFFWSSFGNVLCFLSLSLFPPIFLAEKKKTTTTTSVKKNYELWSRIWLRNTAKKDTWKDEKPFSLLSGDLIEFNLIYSSGSAADSRNKTMSKIMLVWRKSQALLKDWSEVTSSKPPTVTYLKLDLGLNISLFTKIQSEESLKWPNVTFNPMPYMWKLLH